MPYTNVYVRVHYITAPINTYINECVLYTEWCKMHWTLPLVPGDKCSNLYTDNSRLHT